MWTVAELLAWTQSRFADIGIASARLDAELLLADAIGCDRMQLYVRHDQVVERGSKDAFRGLVKRRLQREPVAYIQGKKGFHALDLELSVDRRVLVPRPETEHLVDWLLEELRPPPAPPMHVLDVGTGSGAIALAVKRARAEVEVTGVDVSGDALSVAADNARRAQLDAVWVQSDLLNAVSSPAEGWTAVAANLPYIPSRDFDELEPEVTVHEPRLALDGGDDGLDFVRRLVEQVRQPGVLARSGALYLEIGLGQAAETSELLRQAGFEDVQTRRDYSDVERVVRGFAPRPPA